MRLIDADALKQAINYNGGCGICFMYIDDAETIDAVPAKHGIWVHHKGGFSDHYDCTVCGRDIVLTKKWMYCPNCGAKMDGDCDE